MSIIWTVNNSEWFKWVEITSLGMDGVFSWQLLIFYSCPAPTAASHPHIFFPSFLFLFLIFFFLFLRLTSLSTGKGIFKDSPIAVNAKNGIFRKYVFYFELNEEHNLKPVASVLRKQNKAQQNLGFTKDRRQSLPHFKTQIKLNVISISLVLNSMLISLCKVAKEEKQWTTLTSFSLIHFR